MLRYFLANPDAADTLEGVARWRLLEERIRCVVEEVQHALAWLESAGFLQTVTTPAIGTVYSLRRERLAAAAEFAGGGLPAKGAEPCPCASPTAASSCWCCR